ncbi:MAG: hypothetical protein CYPHOPRED_004720 [Cyphobasidiales sp. Tagirdzhanova-0007]|nr:MAG: hypothetical protein CYPHOPRED_004720 [Cyphobasidiales sp. Tagirdzhanova-0007]
MLLHNEGRPVFYEEEVNAISFTAKTAMYRSLLAMEVYQIMLSRSICPSEEVFSLLERAGAMLEHQTSTFPLLREIASATLPGPASTSYKDTGRTIAFSKSAASASILSKANPDQLLLLAFEARDYALAKPLYRLLRSQHRFRWHNAYAVYYKRFFSAIANDALLFHPSRSAEQFEAACTFAAQLYVEWKADGLATHTETVGVLFELMARMPNISAFRTALDTLLTDETLLLSPRSLVQFFRALKSESIRFSVTRIYSAFQNLISHARYASTVPLGVYNALLGAFAQFRPYHENTWAEKVFSHMQSHGIRPDLQSFHYIMILRRMRTSSAKEVETAYATLLNQGLTPNETTYSLRVEAFLKLGQVDQAVRMADDGLQRSMLVHYRSLERVIQQLVRNDRMEEALQFYEARSAAYEIKARSLRDRRFELAMGRMRAVFGLSQARQSTDSSTEAPMPKIRNTQAESQIVKVEIERPRIWYCTTQIEEEADSIGESHLEASPSFLSAFFTSNLRANSGAVLNTSSTAPAATYRVSGGIGIARIDDATSSRPAGMPNRQTTVSLSSNDGGDTFSEGHDPSGVFPSSSYTYPTLGTGQLSDSLSGSSSQVSTALQSSPLQPSASTTSIFLPFSVRRIHQRIASLSYNQIFALRAQIEREAIRRREEELQRTRDTMWRRADANRWSGWNEFEATPWY